jgi:hypothetical protein
MTTAAIIGSVVRVSEKVASLEPLFEVTHDARSPYRRIENPRADYPDRGRIVWFDPPREAHERTLWRVDVTECVTYHRAEANIDALMVLQGSSPEPLSEIVDLRQVGDEDEIRRRVTGDGIALPQPPSSSVFLWVGPGRFIGPVHLERPASGRQWHLGAAAVEEPIACWEGDQGEILITGAGASSRLFAVSARAWRRTGLTDWNPDDSKVLTRVLKELRKLDPEFARSVSLTTKSIERLGQVIADATVPDLGMHEQRLSRVRNFLGRQEHGLVAGSDVLREVLELPEIREALGEHRATIEKAVRQEITDRVAVELDRERRELEGLAGERAQAAAELEAIRSEIQGRSRDLEELVGSFERTLADRVAAIVERPERFLADAILLRAALGLAPAREPLRPQSNAPRPSHPGTVLSFQEPQQLQLALDLSFQEAGLPRVLGQLVHGAFLAGAVPALVGGRSIDALHAYAHCLTGGRVIRVPLSSGVLSVRDFLDQLSIGMDGTPETKSCLAEAGRQNALTMLILENVNACPLDTVVLPLLRAQRDGEGPIPSNICVGATLSQGAARLPLPTTAWEYLALVDTSGSRSADLAATHPDRRHSTLAPSEMSPTLWNTLRSVAAQRAISRCAQTLDRLRDAISLDIGVRDLALRLFAAFLDSGLDEDSALESVIAVVVMPSLVDRGEDLIAALAQQGLGVEGIRAVMPTAQFLIA